MNGGSVATLSGGSVLSSSTGYAAMPVGTVGNFLAAGPTAGEPAILTFTPGTKYLSFLWGSPDTYNRFTVNTSLGNTAIFTATGLGFSQSGGQQGFAQAVQFKTLSAGEYFTTVSFANSPSSNAFEVSNFRSAVPEPAAWGMLILGFGAAGGVMRRRRDMTRLAHA
ncbi:hypothetical protein A7X12_04485 [Sphingomonas sp. TDK1]|nr:hypothetical protein A7X12_04485 [Sphingomonas sp. TDK1]